MFRALRQQKMEKLKPMKGLTLISCIDVKTILFDSMTMISIMMKREYNKNKFID